MSDPNWGSINSTKYNVKLKDKKVLLNISNASYLFQLYEMKVRSFKSFILVDDPASNNLYDITVTLKDTAKITKDGAVVGGNKVKIGLPITLEGKDYKFNGTVSNIQLAHEAENQMGADINTTDDIQ